VVVVAQDCEDEHSRLSNSFSPFCSFLSLSNRCLWQPSFL